MRIFLAIALSTSVAGCGLAARQERAEQIAAARAQSQAGFEECKARYPEGSKDFIGKHRCDAEAASVLRQFATYPDLFDRYWAFRGVTAERLQAGKITLAEAREQVAENQSKIAAEEQQRNLANRSVAAQETTARAALVSTMPTTCTRNGNSTTCF